MIKIFSGKISKFILFFKFHLFQIKNEGLDALLRKLNIWPLIFSPLYFILAFILICIRKFLIVIFVPISSDPIGHFATETELNYIKISSTIKKFKHRYPKKYIKFFIIFYNRGGICNKSLYRMLKARYLFINSYVARSIILVFRIFKLNSSFPNVPIRNRDILNLREIYPNTLNFDSRKIKRLVNNNINNIVDLNKKYVCILNRESTYHEFFYENIDRHNSYRNVDINDFLPLVIFLNKKGIQVIRMGTKMKSTLNYENNLYFDYSQWKFKSDFLDLYLSGNCEFFVSMSSGLDEIAHQFRRRVYYFNVSPLSHVKIQCTTLFTPKLLQNKVTKKLININSNTFKSAKNLLSTFSLNKLDLEYISNSEDEVSKFSEEIYNFHYNKLTLTDYQKKLQSLFWTKFPFDSNLHYKNLRNSLISPYFLEKHKDILI